MNDKAQAVANGTDIDEYGNVMLTGDAIEHFRFTSLVTAYITEIRTGMKVTRIPLSRVAAQYGITARNKKTALRALLALYEETYGKKFDHPRLAEVL